MQNMLRQWMYREHYHPNIQGDEYEHWNLHAGILLEVGILLDLGC